MANSIILKKSSVPAKVPLVGDLQYGELALNYADGKLYYKKSDGTTIDYFSSGAGSSAAISVGVAPPSSPTAGSLWWDSTYGTLKIYYNDGTSSQWVDASSGAAGGGGGSGDMLKSVYDTTNNGKVDTAEYAETAPWTGISGKPATFPPSTHTHVSADITDLSTTISSAITDHTNAADPHPQYATLAEVAAVSGDLHGIVDRTASTLSFNDGTRTLTITPVSGSWTFYDHGTLYTVSSAKSITIANTAGARFIRIDPATLNLVEGGSVPDFANDVIIAYVYWDTTGSKALIVGDERHGSKRDTTWHSAQHLNVGTVWRSGGDPTYTLNNASSVQVGVGTPIVIADEDLLHNITHSATPTADFEQILNTAASVEVLYLDGTVYTSTTASTTPWIAGTSLARYNQVTAGSGSLVDASEGGYITYWLLATNDIRRPVKMVLGRASHTTLDAAYAETFTEYGLSFAEQVFMYQVVVQTSASYSANTAKIVIAGVRKVLSKVASSSATVSATSHNNLTGRDSPDTHTIGSITGLTSALSGKQDTLISGTNIKTVNGSSIIGSGNLAVGTVTSVAGTGTVNGLTLTGTVTSSGNITLGGTLDLSSPPIIGATAPAAIYGTTIEATSSITASANFGAYSYGTLNYSGVNIFGSFQTSADSYAQLILQNTSATSSASADFIVNNNLSTDTTYYGDFGMNSSAWTGVLGTNSLSAPNIAYLSATTVDLVIGTTTSNAIRFVTGGGADAAVISASGIFSTTSANLTTPALSGATYSTNNNFVAGTNAQGQGPITTDNVVVASTASNPSGVTLPAATTGRMVVIVNKGTNPINIYPALGGQIDALGNNLPIQLAVGEWIEFNASSGTQWYSTVNAMVNASAVNGTLPLTNGGTGGTSSQEAYNNITGFTSTATAGGTTTLTVSSTPRQVFTGTSAQTIVLPVVSTLQLGFRYEIVNNSTKILTVNSSGGNLATTISPGAGVRFRCISLTGTTAASWDWGWNDLNIDTRMVPQNAQTASYGILETDIGKHIYHAAAAAAATYTIPANTAIPFEIGTTLSFVNMSTNAVTIAITTDTMYLAGTGTTGSRTLAQYGVATAMKLTATTWIISGSGLT